MSKILYENPKVTRSRRNGMQEVSKREPILAIFIYGTSSGPTRLELKQLPTYRGAAWPKMVTRVSRGKQT
jgi:hypothetical protein